MTRMERKLPDGRGIDRFTLTNSSGMQVQAITWAPSSHRFECPIETENSTTWYWDTTRWILTFETLPISVPSSADTPTGSPTKITSREGIHPRPNNRRTISWRHKGFDKQVWDAKVGDARAGRRISRTAAWTGRKATPVRLTQQFHTL